MKQIIIGVTGTNGAGKTSVVDYLVNTHGYRHFSMSDYIIRQLEKTKQKIDRDNMRAMGNIIRKNHGPSHIAEQLYKKAIKSKKDSVIESLRNPEEVKFLQSSGNFYLVAVDADPKTRYKRITKRKSSKDKILFVKFLEQEKREMRSKNSSDQQIAKCVVLADYTVINNGSLDELHKSVENVIAKIENA